MATNITGGTLTFTNGSAVVVVATGTPNFATNGVVSGDLCFAPDGKIYPIASGVTDGGFTLLTSYAGSTVTSGTYSVTAFNPSASAVAMATVLAALAAPANAALTGNFGDGALSDVGIGFSSATNTGISRNVHSDGGISIVIGGTEYLTIAGNGAIGVNTTAQNARMDVMGNPLGSAVNSSSSVMSFDVTDSNNDYIKLYAYRNSTGTDYQSASYLLQRITEVSTGTYSNTGGIEFNPSNITMVWPNEGSIAVDNSGTVTLGASSLVKPGTSNTVSLGSAAYYWNDFYTASAKIVGAGALTINSTGAHPFGLYSDGTTAYLASNGFYFKSSDSSALYATLEPGAFAPGADNTSALGASTNHWTTTYTYNIDMGNSAGQKILIYNQSTSPGNQFTSGFGQNVGTSGFLSAFCGPASGAGFEWIAGTTAYPYTAYTIPMTLTNAGQLTLKQGIIVNSSTSAVALSVGGYGSAQYGSIYMPVSNSCYPLVFNNAAGSVVGSIGTSSSGTNFNATSDGRYKSNVVDLAQEKDVGAIFDALEPVAYDWASSHGGERGYGFIAQDLYQVTPEVVAPGDGDPNGKIGDEGHRPWSYDPSKLMPYVAVELKSLRRRVADLEAKLAA